MPPRKKKTQDNPAPAIIKTPGPKRTKTDVHLGFPHYTATPRTRAAIKRTGEPLEALDNYAASIRRTYLPPQTSLEAIPSPTNLRRQTDADLEALVGGVGKLGLGKGARKTVEKSGKKAQDTRAVRSRPLRRDRQAFDIFDSTDGEGNDNDDDNVIVVKNRAKGKENANPAARTTRKASVAAKAALLAAVIHFSSDDDDNLVLKPTIPDSLKLKSKPKPTSEIVTTKPEAEIDVDADATTTLTRTRNLILRLSTTAPWAQKTLWQTDDETIVALEAEIASLDCPKDSAEEATKDVLQNMKQLMNDFVVFRARLDEYGDKVGKWGLVMDWTGEEQEHREKQTDSGTETDYESAMEGDRVVFDENASEDEEDEDE